MPLLHQLEDLERSIYDSHAPQNMQDTLATISELRRRFNLDVFDPNVNPYEGFQEGLYEVANRRYRDDVVYVLDVLDGELDDMRATIERNETTLRHYLNLHTVARSISSNGPLIRNLRRIKTALGLQMFNIPSVSELQSLSIQCRSVGWREEHFSSLQMDQEQELRASLAAAAKVLRHFSDQPGLGGNWVDEIDNNNASAGHGLEDMDQTPEAEITAAQCLNFAGDIIQRNWLSLEELEWRGPYRAGCWYLGSHLCGGAEPFPRLGDLSTLGPSRLVVLNLHHWRISRKNLSTLLENCKYLTALELTECKISNKRNHDDYWSDAAAFQHHGVRYLRASMTTLFAKERHREFRDILQIGAPATLPTGPDQLDGDQHMAIVELESSLFLHFPQLAHWSISKGPDNDHMVPWIGFDIRTYCPDLNMLTISSKAFSTEEKAALMVRVFRPEQQPEDIQFHVDDEQEDMELNPAGYEIGPGRGLKAFRMKENEGHQHFGDHLIKALRLHQSTLESLDLDPDNMDWNLKSTGEPAGKAGDEGDEDFGINNDDNDLQLEWSDDELHWPDDEDDDIEEDEEDDDNVGGNGNGNGNEDIQLLAMPLLNGGPVTPPDTPPVQIGQEDEQELVNGVINGLGHVQAAQQQPTPTVSPPQSLPSPPPPPPQSPQQGPPEFNPNTLENFLRNCRRLRHCKLPNVMLRLDHFGDEELGVWSCTESLEELWIELQFLNPNDIPWVMGQLGFERSRIYRRTSDRYSEPHGVWPVAPRVAPIDAGIEAAEAAISAFIVSIEENEAINAAYAAAFDARDLEALSALILNHVHLWTILNAVTISHFSPHSFAAHDANITLANLAANGVASVRAAVLAARNSSAHAAAAAMALTIAALNSDQDAAAPEDGWMNHAEFQNYLNRYCIGIPRDRVAKDDLIRQEADEDADDAMNGGDETPLLPSVVPLGSPELEMMIEAGEFARELAVQFLLRFPSLNAVYIGDGLYRRHVLGPADEIEFDNEDHGFHSGSDTDDDHDDMMEDAVETQDANEEESQQTEAEAEAQAQVGSFNVNQDQGQNQDEGGPSQNQGQGQGRRSRKRRAEQDDDDESVQPLRRSARLARLAEKRAKLEVKETKTED
ncbi:hypothetical protein BGZ58_003638 [Dissophora ornata]|nr:hypothetical protein BGZ58_003638 [Dissophora ornata]